LPEESDTGRSLDQPPMRTATCFATPDPETTHHVRRAVTLAGKWLINVNQTVAKGLIFDQRA
jgi:hypothetical protein